MNVAEDVNFRSDPLEFYAENPTPHIFTAFHFIEDPKRWSVGDENVDVCGDSTPAISKFFPASRKIEGPVTKTGLPRASIDRDPVESDGRVFQIMNSEIFGKISKISLDGLMLKTPVMIPSHEDLVAVGLGAKPLQEALKLFLAPSHRGITRMNEKVSVWETERKVGIVRVTYGYDFHGIMHYDFLDEKGSSPCHCSPTIRSPFRRALVIVRGSSSRLDGARVAFTMFMHTTLLVRAWMMLPPVRENYHERPHGGQPVEEQEPSNHQCTSEQDDPTLDRPERVQTHQSEGDCRSNDCRFQHGRMEHEGREGAGHASEKDEQAVKEAPEGKERGEFGLDHGDLSSTP